MRNPRHMSYILPNWGGFKTFWSGIYMLAATFGGEMNKVKFIICILFILLLSISIEATYHKIGHCGEPYWSRDLALVDSTVLVPDETGIQIIDVSEPDNPVYIGCFNVTETCLGIEVSGDIAYIANTSDGLLILDISNPQSPQFLGSCETPDCALSLVVSDTIVYIADRNAGLQIIDVSVPQNPEIIGNFNTFNANNIEISDTLVFVSNYLGNIQVIDVSDPSLPTLVYEYVNTPQWVNDILVIDSIAYVTTSNDGLLIYDVIDPTVFNLISTYETAHAGAISISQNIAYLSCAYSGFQVLNISNISDPELIGVLETPRCAGNALVSDNIAYITDLYTGLEIYDISEPENPNVVGSVDTPHLAMSISISEDIAYVADYDSYIQILDISNPGFPYIINSYGIFYTVVDFLIEENYGYAITSSRLYIFRLDDLIYPEIISYIEIGGTNNSVEYYNSHVYVTSLFEGIKIINVNNPQNPYIVGECDTPGRAYDLLVSGDIVYVANGNHGLTIIDASDLTNPFILPYFNTHTPSNVSSLAMADDILYLAGNYDGLKVVDISDPISPVFLQSILPHSDSRFKIKPIIIDDKLIVEDRNWNEILTFDITDPANPELINTYIWNLSTRDWEAYEDYLVTVNGYQGVSILDLESITSINENPIVQPDIELDNYPNPFNPSTTISFSLQNNSNIELSIYNIKGQKVKSLVKKSFESGNHSVIWDGNDDTGKPVSSGIYLYKLNVNGKAKAVRKCLLLK